MKKRIGQILLAIVVLGLFGGIYHFFSLKERKRKILTREKNYQILLKAAEQLQHRYQSGDRENLIGRGILKCQKLPQSKYYHQGYSKCNPYYIDCFFNTKLEGLKNKFFVNFEGKDHRVQANPIFGNKKYYKIITQALFPLKKVPHYSIQVNLTLASSRDLSIDVLLEDRCHMVYLPRRRYIYREHSDQKSEEHIWDNFDRNIYVDQKLVSYQDIAQWLESGVDEKISIPSDPYQWPLPASNLSIDQMEKYCKFLGKKVIDTLVYDAATFYPLNIKQSNYRDRYFPPYPWSKNKPRGKKKHTCDDILSLECSRKQDTIQNSPHQRTSWMGLKDILGGHPEYIKNTIYPQYNLKTSSFYLSNKSYWHQLGYRSSWSKDSFMSDNFTFKGEQVFKNIHDNIRVGFRCILEVFGKT